MAEYIDRLDASTIPVMPVEHRVPFKTVDEAFEEGWRQALEMVAMMEPADVVERTRWIPVTERLPKDEQRVLAYYGFDRGDGYLGMMFTQVLDYFARDPRPHFQYEGTNGMKVTHWMPLPEPPKRKHEHRGRYRPDSIQV